SINNSFVTKNLSFATSSSINDSPGIYVSLYELFFSAIKPNVSVGSNLLPYEPEIHPVSLLSLFMSMADSFYSTLDHIETETAAQIEDPTYELTSLNDSLSFVDMKMNSREVILSSLEFRAGLSARMEGILRWHICIIMLTASMGILVIVIVTLSTIGELRRYEKHSIALLAWLYNIPADSRARIEEILSIKSHLCSSWDQSVGGTGKDIEDNKDLCLYCYLFSDKPLPSARSDSFVDSARLFHKKAHSHQHHHSVFQPPVGDERRVTQAHRGQQHAIISKNLLFLPNPPVLLNPSLSAATDRFTRKSHSLDATDRSSIDRDGRSQVIIKQSEFGSRTSSCGKSEQERSIRSLSGPGGGSVSSFPSGLQSPIMNSLSYCGFSPHDDDSSDVDIHTVGEESEREVLRARRDLLESRETAVRNSSNQPKDAYQFFMKHGSVSDQENDKPSGDAKNLDANRSLQQLGVFSDESNTEKTGGSCIQRLFLNNFVGKNPISPFLCFQITKLIILFIITVILISIAYHAAIVNYFYQNINLLPTFQNNVTRVLFSQFEKQSLASAHCSRLALYGNDYEDNVDTLIDYLSSSDYFCIDSLNCSSESVSYLTNYYDDKSYGYSPHLVTLYRVASNSIRNSYLYSVSSVISGAVHDIDLDYFDYVDWDISDTAMSEFFIVDSGDYIYSTREEDTSFDSEEERLAKQELAWGLCNNSYVRINMHNSYDIIMNFENNIEESEDGGLIYSSNFLNFYAQKRSTIVFLLSSLVIFTLIWLGFSITFFSQYPGISDVKCSVSSSGFWLMGFSLFIIISSIIATCALGNHTHLVNDMLSDDSNPVKNVVYAVSNSLSLLEAELMQFDTELNHLVADFRLSTIENSLSAMYVVERRREQIENEWQAIQDIDDSDTFEILSMSTVNTLVNDIFSHIDTIMEQLKITLVITSCSADFEIGNVDSSLAPELFDWNYEESEDYKADEQLFPNREA
ncbi:hypothetical protein ADUPG1_009584, partial [Aduncisulcus paluster]